MARSIAEGTHDSNLLFIPDVARFDYTLQEGEALGFVFPCYAWGVPVFVEEFVRKLRLENVGYVYFVCTCGDDTGRTCDIFRRLMEEKGWTCSLGYDVQMPESYVNLPGFDVDPKDKERRKIDTTAERLPQIIRSVNERATGVFDILPGRFTWLKSCVVRPFFNRFLITPRPFKSTDKCVSCGKCAEVCPYDNIEMKRTAGTSAASGIPRPMWGDCCVGCMRCYHSCPSRAIEWGRFTRGKGQYLFSTKKLSSSK